MRSIRQWKLVPLLAGIVLVAGGCYWTQARLAAENGDPVPWFCNPVAANSVTGPGMGTTNWYAGTSRAPLDHNTCQEVALQFDQAKSYAKGYPTLGDAEAAGFIASFAYIPGMGTHHGNGTISPALLADPNFDPHNPIIPNSIVDDVFDPAKPEFLQYNGNTPDSELVGISYYVRTNTGLPPEGFAGNNDWWHHHPTLCLNPATAKAQGVNTTDSGCASSGGINVHLQDYYMLHIWLVDNLEYRGDVHAPMHPCIQSSAIFDMSDPCHQNYTPAGAMARMSAKEMEAVMPGCPLGTLAKD